MIPLDQSTTQQQHKRVAQQQGSFISFTHIFVCNMKLSRNTNLIREGSFEPFDLKLAVPQGLGQGVLLGLHDKKLMVSDNVMANN